ncbi:MAG: L,D-transpeptidase [Amylibacter sp.]|jgi:lipoprotein-anchoring transpeptidase ErfK/SrfK|tara:strand:- start:930 stop:1568 length:639 start_codon:yes stop_codon:yes gene_type:complete
MSKCFTRRTFTATAASAITLGTYSVAQEGWNPDLNNPDLGFNTPQNPESRLAGEADTVRRNASAFRDRSNWRDYFSNTKKGVVLVDTQSRALHFWSEDQSIYKLYPVAVPSSDELTRLGRTSITRKRVGPDWRPTPSMLERNPDWPKYIGPGPGNPLGSHALYLSWTYFRIHGTHDNRKIGRRSSNGCIGLYNAQIAELFDLTRVGTQVLFI